VQILDNEVEFDKQLINVPIPDPEMAGHLQQGESAKTVSQG
jgi:hypothetical protein